MVTPALRRSWKHTRSSAERGYGREWQRLRLVVLRRDRYLCQCAECKEAGRVRLAAQVDHIVPKARGGSDDPSNLQAINAACHRRKTELEQGKRPRVAVGLDGWPLE